MNNQTKKLKDFVTRNELFVETAAWLNNQILTVIDDYELYQQTGKLPEGYKSEKDLYDKMLELDKRASVEERVYKQLQAEQQQLLRE
ncbi:hypothetical protein H8E06_01215 [bacterium]|nr:hypothetical protein [bacterium]